MGQFSLFAKKIILPLAELFLKTKINKRLSYWRKIQWYEPNDFKYLQKNKLKRLLSHVEKNVPYYAEYMGRIKMDIHEDPYGSLKKMPVLTKDIIKQNLPNNIIDNNKTIYQIDKTSGSSGEQGTFYHDKFSYSNTIAIQTLWWEWAGYQLGCRMVLVGMNPIRGFIKRVKDFLFRTIYFEAFNLSDKKIAGLLKKLNQDRFFIMGYPSAIYQIAKYAKENNIDGIKVNSVVCFGDKVFDHYRKTIESVFNTTLYDTYGACEGTMIAAECEEHVKHIMSPHVIVEVLDDEGKEVKYGELGHLHITHLDNFLMPLIRYKIGDLGIVEDDQILCKCGRNLPILKKLIGRDTDIVYTKSGKPLIVHFFTGIFEHFDEIKQFQVVQTKNNPFIINYIPSDSFDKLVLEEIRSLINEGAYEKVEFKFNSVDVINDSPSGKPQIVIRNKS